MQTTLLTAKSFSFKLDMIIPTWQTTSPWSSHNVLIRAAIKRIQFNDRQYSRDQWNRPINATRPRLYAVCVSIKLGTESSKTGAVSVNAYRRAKGPKFHTFHNIFIFLWARQCECIKKIYQEGISKRNNVCLYNPRNKWEPINLKLSF